MAFNNLVGNTRVKKILQKALEKDRLPNSLLFSGPMGIGKKETAIVVAKALNCLQKKNDSCDECRSCKAIDSGNSPDVMNISPQKDTLKKEQIGMLKQTAYLRPMVGKKRVFVVDDIEKMSKKASNSILKVLEEPPSFTHILLITHNPFLIIPTIKSRCQILTFSEIIREDIKAELIKRGYDEEKAGVISLLVRGNLKHALSLDWDEIHDIKKKAWALFRSFLQGENMSSFLNYYAYRQKAFIGRDLKLILELLSSFFRDLILIKEKGDTDFMLNPDYEKEIKEMENLRSVAQLVKFMSRIDYVNNALQKNLNINLLVSSTFINFMEEKHV